MCALHSYYFPFLMLELERCTLLDNQTGCLSFIYCANLTCASIMCHNHRARHFYFPSTCHIIAIESSNLWPYFRWLIHSFRDKPYSGGDCVTVQGSLGQNAIFSEQKKKKKKMEDFPSVFVLKKMEDFPWKMDMYISFIR